MLQVEPTMTVSGGQLDLQHVRRRKASLKLISCRGGTLKIWKNLLWITSLIAFGLKSNGRLELPLKRGFTILGYFFWGGGG